MDKREASEPILVTTDNITAGDDEPQPTSLAKGWMTPFGRIESLEQAVMVLGLVTLVGAICWGVLSRYVITTPAAWVEEVTSICFTWMIFFGSAEAHRRRMHIGVDMLTLLLPPLARRLLEIVVEALVAAFCLYASYLGLQQTIVSHVSSTSILRIPLSIGYMGLTLGLFLMGLRSIQFLISDIRVIRRVE